MDKEKNEHNFCANCIVNHNSTCYGNKILSVNIAELLFTGKIYREAEGSNTKIDRMAILCV